MKKHKGFSIASAVGIVAAVAAIGIIGFLIIEGPSKTVNYSSYNPFSIIKPDANNGYIGDNVKGNPDAPAIIFEYADFQCPGCASINTRVNAAIEKAEGKLAVVYRNFILSYHQNGIAAASAAQAAGLQGYYKPFADRLFKGQAEWEYASPSKRTALFQEYFEEVTDKKGDLEKFISDLGSEQISKKIDFDTNIGKHLGVPGTPSFYVDGQYIDYTNKEGGSITVNNRVIGWETRLTNDQFEDLLVRIAKAKTEE